MNQISYFNCSLSVFIVLYLVILINQIFFMFNTKHRIKKFKKFNKEEFKVPYDAYTNWNKQFNLIFPSIFIFLAYICFPAIIPTLMLSLYMHHFDLDFQWKASFLIIVVWILAFLAYDVLFLFNVLTKKQANMSFNFIKQINFQNILDEKIKSIQITSNNKTCSSLINYIYWIIKRNVKLYNKSHSLYYKKTIEIYVYDLLQIIAKKYLLRRKHNFNELIQIKINDEFIYNQQIDMNKLMILFFNHFELLIDKNSTIIY